MTEHIKCGLTSDVQYVLIAKYPDVQCGWLSFVHAKVLGHFKLMILDVNDESSHSPAQQSKQSLSTPQAPGFF